MLRYFRFFTLDRGKRVAIRYGFGDIDDAIRFAHVLDAHFAEPDPLADYRFEFESVSDDEAIDLDEDSACVLLCSREELDVFEAAQQRAAA